MIVSRSERAIPAARTARNEEPYSTRRARSRSYQTRCGIWWTSGCAPVAIDDRQTGVSDGKVETAREYRPRSARYDRAGVRSSPTAASNIDGVSPSITIKMTLVAGKSAKAGVPLLGTASQAGRQGRHERRFQIAGGRDPGHRRDQQRGQADE